MKIWTAPLVSLVSRQEFALPENFKDLGWAPLDDDGEDLAEFAGRLCYLSFGEGQVDGHSTVKGRTSQKEYFENILKTKHGSVLEHTVFSFLFEGVSRSFTHELVRHRAGFGFSQLSQRFVDERNVGFVVPPLILSLTNKLPYRRWEDCCRQVAADYTALLLDLESVVGGGSASTAEKKRIREAARSVLNNATETKIVVTANARAWRHFIEMRGSPAADLEMIRLTEEVAFVLKSEASSIFQDVYFAKTGVEVLHSKV